MCRLPRRGIPSGNRRRDNPHARLLSQTEAPQRAVALRRSGAFPSSSVVETIASQRAHAFA
jgi:hypothetical protein